MADIQDHGARDGRSIPVGPIVVAHAAAPVAGAAERCGGQAVQPFTPLERTLPAEDTITFVNDDLTSHNIDSDIAGHEFEINPQALPQIQTVSFSKP